MVTTIFQQTSIDARFKDRLKIVFKQFPLLRKQGDKKLHFNFTIYFSTLLGFWQYIK